MHAIKMASGENTHSDLSLLQYSSTRITWCVLWILYSDAMDYFIVTGPERCVCRLGCCRDLCTSCHSWYFYDPSL